MDDTGSGWSGLSDFINSVEGPTLGVIALAQGGSVSQANGSLSASTSPTGTFAGSGAAGTGGMMSTFTPGMLIIGLGAIALVVALIKS